MGPTVTAHLKIDTQGVEQGMAEARSTVKKFRGFMGDAMRHSLTALGGSISGVITATMTKTIKSGLDQAFSLEGAQVAMTSMLGSLDKAKDAMAMISKEAKENPMFSKKDLAEASQALVGFADRSVPKLGHLVELSEKLSTLKPEAGLNGAAQALRDAIGGETERLKEYGFTGKELSAMKQNAGPGADLSKAIETALDKKGITDKTLLAMSQTRMAGLAGLQNQLTNIGEDFVNNFWPKLEPEMKGLKEFLAGNKQEIIAGMSTVGDGIIAAFKGAKFLGGVVDKVSSYLGDKAYNEIYSSKGEFRSSVIAGTRGIAQYALAGGGYDAAKDVAKAEYINQRGAQLGKRGRELASQVNIHVQAANSSMLPQGMAHT